MSNNPSSSETLKTFLAFMNSNIESELNDDQEDTDLFWQMVSDFGMSLHYLAKTQILEGDRK